MLDGIPAMSRGKRAVTIRANDGTQLVQVAFTPTGLQRVAAGDRTPSLYQGILNDSNKTIQLNNLKFDPEKDKVLMCQSYRILTSAKEMTRAIVTGSGVSQSNCQPLQLGMNTADITAPTVPLNVTATAVGPGQVNLAWTAANDNVGVVRYNVYRGDTAIANLGNVTGYSDISPLASMSYSYTVTACDVALNCSGPSAKAPVATPAQTSLVLRPYWNLVGNGGNTPMEVQSLFGDATKVITLWKWVRTAANPAGNWAFYTPDIADGGVVYAANKGYDTLTSIQSGEGFWVNAKVAFSVPMTAPAWILSGSFQPGQSLALASGWSLIATGEAQTASAFNKAIGITPSAAGDIPLNLNTLWAWDRASSHWYFYAPALEADGSLPTYVSSKGYLDFGSMSLMPSTGFWVNKK